MTIVKALYELKAMDIKNLVGMVGVTDIDRYISNAEDVHNTAVKYAAEGIACHQYTLDHEDDSRLIATADGHYIIATRYGDIEMATYSNYSTEDEMNAVFEEIQISEKAEEVADEMEIKRPHEFPRAVWVAIATAEIRAAYAAASEMFKREYCTER